MSRFAWSISTGGEFRTDANSRPIDLTSVDSVTVEDDALVQLAYWIQLEVPSGQRYRRELRSYFVRMRYKFPSVEFAEQVAMVFQRLVDICVASEVPGSP